MKVYLKEDIKFVGTFLRLEDGMVYYTDEDGYIETLWCDKVILKEDDNKKLLLG